MKILLAGGGSGGHFYPLIAIVEELDNLIAEKHLIPPKYFYMADDPYDEKALFEHNIEFIKISAGKLRLYSSIHNLLDPFRTLWGIIGCTAKLFRLYPDVVVGKGGYASFPTMVAARILGIPVIIHESDAVPGRVNKFAGKFAKRIGVAYASAADYFSGKDVALVGVPIRRELAKPIKEGAFEFLKLDKSIPTVLIVGGSQGAQTINDTVVDVLPELLSRYQIIHQVGTKNVQDLTTRLSVVLGSSEYKDRYKMFGFLSGGAMAMAAGAAKLVVTRAGSTAIFEVAGWGLPSIVIPIPKEVSRDQYENAFNYARTGAGVLLEEANLTPHILLAEIDRILTNPDLQNKMSEAARAFSKPDAARKMAESILDLVLPHEQ